MSLPMQPATLIRSAAVDVGFSNTKYAWDRDETAAIHAAHFPSDAVQAIRPATPNKKRPSGFYVEVDGATYFTGTGVTEMGRVFGARRVQDGYVRTPEYKALLLGALASIAKCGIRL